MHKKDSEYHRLKKLIEECHWKMELMMANDEPAEVVLFLRKRIRFLEKRKLRLLLSPKYMFKNLNTAKVEGVEKQPVKDHSSVEVV